jgi:hypothetical protein
MRSSSKRIQPIAKINPGMIPMTAMRVTNVVLSAIVVRFSSHASGNAKNVETKIAPIPTMAVLGITLVHNRSLKTIFQWFSVKPRSVGKPGTKVMYRTNKTRTTMLKRTSAEHAKGSAALLEMVLDQFMTFMNAKLE